MATCFKHEGTPAGKTVKVGRHDAYLALANPEIERKKSGILYVPDVLGIRQDSMLLADQFASAGYTTLIIDLYNGDALKMEEVPELDLQAWIKNGRNGSGPHTPTEIDPIIGEAVSYMKTDLGVERIGAVGFSFGSKYVVRHLGRGIQVAYVGYPSFVDDEELTAVGGPLSIAAAETETIFSLDKRIRAEEILRQNGNVYQINLFSGVSHGFAVTCDLENRRERFGKEQAFKQAVEFFDYWLV